MSLLCFRMSERTNSCWTEIPNLWTKLWRKEWVQLDWNSCYKYQWAILNNGSFFTSLIRLVYLMKIFLPNVVSFFRESIALKGGSKLREKSCRKNWKTTEKNSKRLEKYNKNKIERERTIVNAWRRRNSATFLNRRPEKQSPKMPKPQKFLALAKMFQP